MSLTINTKTDRLFIAICREGIHSFVMLGRYTGTQVTDVLAKVGKMFVRTSCLPPILSSCTTSQAYTLQERMFKPRADHQPISYQAYDITYEQYLAFIQMLEEIQTKRNRFFIYKPKNQHGDIVTLEQTDESMSVVEPVCKAMNPITDQISVTNTCRHTAIDIVEKVQGRSHSPMVSTLFFKNLPYTTQMKAEPAEAKFKTARGSYLDERLPSPHIPFYVLPVPPTAFLFLSDERKKVLEKLYHQMEHMLLIQTSSPKTVNKFNCLKEYYLSIINQEQPLSADALLASIVNWKSANEATLSELRETFFWDYFITRQSATMRMLAEVEQDLRQATPCL